MTQEHDIKRKIEEKLAIEYEGKAFEHIWLCKIGDQWHIHKDYYAVIKGEVFSLFRTDKVLSGDSIFTTVKDCVCIGDYDPNKWYQRVQRSFDLPPVMTETKIEKRLKSIVCICLERKQKGKPFCRKCFTKLPDDLKQRLSNQLVEDFLVAYDEAKAYLQSN